MSPSTTLSYSSVRTYLECPLRWKYLYIDKIPEAPRGYFSFGRTVHSVLEELIRPLVVPLARSTPSGQTQRTLEQFVSPSASGSAPTPMAEDELMRTYERLWVSEGYTSPEEEQRYRALGREILLRYYRQLVQAPPAPVAVEEHLEARWDGIPIHGYVDRIDLRPSGGLEVLDYKTTRGLSQADAQGSDQLSFYQVLVERNYKAPVESLALYDLRGSLTLRVPSRSAEELRPLSVGVGEVADGLRAEAYEPTPGRHCQRCEFRGRCPEFREVPESERARMTQLVDRFVQLRDDESRVDSELRRVAEELHAEAERLGLHRVEGTSGTALRRREERWSFPPEAVRPFLTRGDLLDRLRLPEGAEVKRLLKDPSIDPELRRRLSESGRRSVRWFWEVDADGASPNSRNG
ncbi:MAG TPA: PD-(D/E)XK nuclease family protein [Thermoplasmata archaeon]|nr:PD-(D/E)XK nuclease family protein [Thermoplasmata archaeon]